MKEIADIYIKMTIKWINQAIRERTFKISKIDLKNKSIFITGVAGFIGSNLAKRLLSTVEGVKVVGLDNMNHYYDVRLKEARLNELERFENFSFVKGNLADKAVIESIFEQYKPEIVVNLGAQAGVRYSITNPDAYVEANLIGFYFRPCDSGAGYERNRNDAQ